MKDLQPYRSLMKAEYTKFFSSIGNRWIFAFVMILMWVLPWLTLRKFDVKFEEYSWWYLDTSPLNFIIHSSAYRLTWILVIIIPWLYYLLFSAEHRHLLSRNNRLILYILGNKAVLYILIICSILALIWSSTFLLYRFWCSKEGIAPSPDDWVSFIEPMINLVIRLVLIFPSLVILFVVFSKNWSYAILSGLLVFSAFLLLELPYQFHYNVHHPRFNQEWLHISLISACFLVLGLVVYYRFFTNKTYVLP